MTILCATHFSEAARQAALAAGSLAHKRGEPLVLVHVLSGDLARALGPTLKETAEAALTDEARRVEREVGGQVSWRLVTGEPAETLAALAHELKASLVVTAGPTSGTPFLGLGGTVDRLATTLPVPLWVVRQETPFREWLSAGRPLRVMVGVDRSGPAEAAREWVAELRKTGPVEVVAGRVYWPHEEYQRLGLPHAPGFQEVTPELTRALEQEVRGLVAPLEAGGTVKVRVSLGIGRIADHLVALAAEEQVDLLVVGTHRRRGLGKLWSVSHHALRLARMSVVSVPAEAHTGVGVVPPLRSVLVATDFSETGNRAVPYAFSLLPAGGMVYVVHVAGAKVAPALERELEARLRALLPKDAEAQGREVEVQVVAGEDTAKALLQAAERLNVDVLCMGTHGSSALRTALMGSVAREVMQRADRPVMVVRPPE